MAEGEEAPFPADYVNPAVAALPPTNACQCLERVHRRHPCLNPPIFCDWCADNGCDRMLGPPVGRPQGPWGQDDDDDDDGGDGDGDGDGDGEDGDDGGMMGGGGGMGPFGPAGFPPFPFPPLPWMGPPWGMMGAPPGMGGPGRRPQS